MITTKVPRTWIQLQTEVGLILKECGFEVEIEKVIKSARGKVEIDVSAEEIIKGRKYTIICECKYWKRKIPQTNVHAFRTVVAELGANIGYLISMKGFQSGAKDSSELTNIELVTWEDFQKIFEESWYESYFSPAITLNLDPLLTYTEPLLPMWFDDLPKKDQILYISLKDKYDEFGWLMMGMTTYMQMMKKGVRPKLPLIDNFGGKEDLIKKIPENILRAKGYRELYELSIEYGNDAIRNFRDIRDRKSKPNEE